MQDLIARLEAESGPLPYEEAIQVWCALNDVCYVGSLTVGRGDAGEDDLLFLCDNGGRRQRTSISVLDLPDRSIDAALTLVPEGFEWQLGGEVPSESGEARIWDSNSKFFTGFASTPALALCIASLRARQAMAGVER